MLGMSDAEERAVFGCDDDWDEDDWDEDDWDEGWEVDRRIDEMKEEGNWPW